MNKETFKRSALGVSKYVGTTAGGLVITALLKGEPLPGLLKLKGLKAVLATGIPLWVTLLMSLAVVALAQSWLRTLRKKLYISVSPDSARWSSFEFPEYDAMEIKAAVRFKTSNTTDTVILIEGYLKGTQTHYHFEEPINVPPGSVIDAYIKIWETPVLAKQGNTLDAVLCFRDIEGYEYKTGKLYFEGMDR
jgi:hypothetical protein